MFKQAVKYYDLIGNTPLVDLTSLANPKHPGVKVNICLLLCAFFFPFSFVCRLHLHT